MYDSGTRLAAEVSKDVETFFATHATETHCWTNSRTFATRIRRNIRLAEAPSFGQSIFDYDARSHGAEDYCSLAQEVLGSAVPEPARHPSVVSAADVVSAELTLSHPKV